MNDILITQFLIFFIRLVDYTATMLDIMAKWLSYRFSIYQVLVLIWPLLMYTNIKRKKWV
jgi:uncharacterized membrane protein YwaF